MSCEAAGGGRETDGSDQEMPHIEHLLAGFVLAEHRIAYGNTRLEHQVLEQAETRLCSLVFSTTRVWLSTSPT